MVAVCLTRVYTKAFDALNICNTKKNIYQ